MQVLIIGLGSMGKRRVRCLKALGCERIIGFDLREDRRREASEIYGIQVVGSLEKALIAGCDALVISTSPESHNQYLKLAVENGRPAFVEASVILDGLKALDELAAKKHVLIAPSCTLRFHPAVKDIKELIGSGKYGKVTSYTCYSGQYLPDWHPWEAVKEYYVSKKETGGCREIVPFELTWLVYLVGLPKRVLGLYGKTMDVGADIDDTYALAMDSGECFGTLTVDVVSRYATRTLILNTEGAQISWSGDNMLKLYDSHQKKWVQYTYAPAQTAEGYTRTIAESMYIEELGLFLQAVAGKGAFANTLEDDIKILETLHQIEVKN